MTDNENTPQVNSTENENLTLEERIKDLSKKLITLAPLFCGIGIAIWWVFSGMIEIKDAHLSLVDQLKQAVIMTFVALIYTAMIAQGGFSSAKNSKEYQTECKLWSGEIKRGNTHKPEIIMYATDIAKNNQKELRTNNLEKVGIDYNSIFDENGNLIALDYKNNKFDKVKNPNGFLKGQIKMIKHCVNIVIIIPEMFGNISSRFFGIQKRETQKQFETKSNTKNGVTRVLFNLVTCGITFAWVGLNPSGVIFALFQIVVWTASAISQRIKNYNFVINVLLPQIVENRLIISGYMDLSEEKKLAYQKRVQEEKERRERKLITLNTDI